MIGAPSEAQLALGLPAGRGRSGQSLQYHFVRKLLATELDRFGIGRHLHRFHRNPGIMTHVTAKRNAPAAATSAVASFRPKAIYVR